MKIQAYLTAAIVNLKRLAAALYALMLASIAFRASALTKMAHSSPQMFAMQKLHSIAA